MRLENPFFLALAHSRTFWEQVKNPATRMKAEGGGYSLEGFGPEDHDYIILPRITANTVAEFTQQYLDKKEEMLRKKS